MSRGVLIVLEGIDGAGTTTQAARLANALTERHYLVHLTCEPSSGPVGQLLRAMLAGAHAPVDATTMSLLFAADRADHVAREVTPALARGAVVISDRWYHSSLAYQGAGEKRQWIWQLNQRALRPDLTLLLELDPQTAAERRARAGRTEELFDALETQRQIARGYRETVAMLQADEPIRVLDGGASVDTVHGEVLEAVLATCKRLASRLMQTAQV